MINRKEFEVCKRRAAMIARHPAHRNLEFANPSLRGDGPISNFQVRVQ